MIQKINGIKICFSLSFLNTIFKYYIRCLRKALRKIWILEMENSDTAIFYVTSVICLLYLTRLLFLFCFVPICATFEIYMGKSHK